MHTERVIAALTSESLDVAGIVAVTGLSASVVRKALRTLSSIGWAWLDYGTGGWRLSRGDVDAAPAKVSDAKGAAKGCHPRA